MADKKNRTSTPALRVRQWLPGWNAIPWKPSENRSEPPQWFYQFNMPATYLRRLSGVYPRTTKRSRGSADFGIQRRLDESRSTEISRFVEFGYPWSALSERKRNAPDFQDLRQPGWLPTSVVVNILTSGDERAGKCVAVADLIEIVNHDDGTAELRLPDGLTADNWKPEILAPIEVIDGQHRLWAFDRIGPLQNYELPVIAFVGLDLSWQAYLFYTINIKPKKINASLAFDLYPLLRTEQWLEKFEGHSIYRETRSQELVDKLWAHAESPWYHRINMLGDTGHKGRMVTQSAWVRSLMASFVKSWEGRRTKIGGIFGAKVGSHETVLPWAFSEQAAFLIFLGQKIEHAVGQNHDEWADSLRDQDGTMERDYAFFGPNNLLNQDQGIRTLMQVANDLFFLNADTVGLSEWGGEGGGVDPGRDDAEITEAIQSLRKNRRISRFATEVAVALAKYDWRASSFAGLTEEQRVLKAAFRGSGGYKELRKHVLSHIAEGRGRLAADAVRILQAVG